MTTPTVLTAPAPLLVALDALHASLARLGVERDSQRLYHAAVAGAAALFEAAQCALFLDDEETGRRSALCAAHGLSEEQVRDLSAIADAQNLAVPADWPPSGVVRLLDEEHRHLAGPGLQKLLGEKDGLLALLHAGERSLGVLWLATKTGGAPFTDADVHLLGLFAGQLGMMIHSLRLLDQEQQSRHLAEKLAALENARLFQQLQVHLRQSEQRSQQLAGLSRISTRLSASLDLSEVLQNTVEELAQALNVAQVGLVLLDWAAGSGRLVAEYQCRPDCTGADTRIPLDGNPSLARVIESKAPLAIRDAQHDPLMAPVHDLMQRRGVKSILLLPLVVGGEVIGTIGLDELVEVRDFSPAEVELALTITNQAAAAIANAQLFADVRRRAVQLETIQEVTGRITAILDPEQLVFEVTDLLAQRFGYYHVHVFLVDADGNYLLARGGNGTAGRQLVAEQVRLRIGQDGICGWTAATGHTAIVNDVTLDPRYIQHPLLSSTRSEMVVPMKLRGQVMGILNVESERAHAFEESDRFLMETLADQVAVALENARLFGALQERAHQLAAAYDELQALDRMKDEFVQTVSHELRTPLTFIKGYVELLQDGGLGHLTPEMAQALGIVAQRTQHIIRLVNDIITLTRAESAQLAAEPQNLIDIAQASLHSALAVTSQAGIRLQTDFPDDLPLVRGDYQHLIQVFDNLIGNAIKFSPDGGAICVRLRSEGNMVRVEVRDQGIGIPADHLQRVWERFYQVDSTTTRRFGGTGLGLAIVKRVIEAHGGQVGVESAEGQGCVFHFTVPVFAA